METKLHYPKRLFCLLVQQTKPVKKEPVLHMAFAPGDLDQASSLNVSGKPIAVYELKELPIYEDALTKYGDDGEPKQRKRGVGSGKSYKSGI